MTEDLSLLAPDSSRGAQTVERCHKQLAILRWQIEARNRRPNQKAVVVERLLLAGMCVVYLVSMAGNVLR